MKKYSGIDLHSNNSVVVVSDEEDRLLYRRRLPNELGRILEALEPYREELAGVVVESTYNWYWLVDGLQVAERGLRDLARRRAQLVRHRTMHVLAVENVQARQSGSRMSGDKVKRLRVQDVKALGLPEDVARACRRT